MRLCLEELKLQHENNFEQLNTLNARLKDLDEQGLVLTLAAFADDSLGELLTAYMFKNAAAKQLVSGYDAPLGTFSAKINAAFALGLITEGQYSDLQHLRKVRNFFSHTWEPINLDNVKVKSHILALNFSNLIDTYPSDLRVKLETSISALLLELKAVITSAHKQRKSARPIASRLYAGLASGTESDFDLCLLKIEQILQRVELVEGEERRFLLHLKKMWIEKTLRSIGKGPKADVNGKILKLFTFVSPEETKFENIYEGYRE